MERLREAWAAHREGDVLFDAVYVLERRQVVDWYDGSGLLPLNDLAPDLRSTNR